MTDLSTKSATTVEDKPEAKEPLGIFFWICVGWLGLNVLAALFGPWLPIQDPNASDYSGTTAMSLNHWMGLDQNGRDIFSRLILGARTSIGISFGSMCIGFGVGGTFGLIAAYRRGIFDLLASSLAFVLLAFPSIIGVIAVLTIWQPVALSKIIIVVGVTSIPLVYRVIRAATLATASKEYVTAAQVMGARDSRVVMKEILPNVMPTGLSFLLFGMATVIVFEGVLAFLGLSIPSYISPSWGNMISAAQDAITATPLNWPLIIFPSLIMFLFVLSLNFVGDRLRSYFDVTEVKL